MKKLMTLFFFAALILSKLNSQSTPTGINYQAVARDNSGTELANQSLDVRFSIFLNSPSGSLEWQENQSTQTNQFGLFTVTIGLANNKIGGSAPVFDSIKWGDGPHYLMVEVNFGGSSYINMGTTQMLAVPYALYAKTAGNTATTTDVITYDPLTQKLYVNSREVADFSGIGANAVQNINLNGNTLTYAQNGQDHTIDFSKYLDNTDSQTLSLKGRELSISNGNTVMLPDTVVQTLSLNNQVLSISKGNSITLPNQIQDLTWANDTVLQITNNPAASRITLKKFLNNQLTADKNRLSILNGNTVIVNTDTTKQDLSLANDTILKITNNPNATPINLKKYLNNQLSVGKNKLSISNGNTVVINTDTTKQDLSLANDTILKITNNPNATPINLKKYLNNQLSVGKNKLSISNGNTVVVNTDTTKQDLAVTNDTLYITKNQSPTKIGLTKYLDNTDNQTLTLTGNSMTISGGNTIDVSTLVNVPWEGFSYYNNSGIAVLGGQESQIAWNKEFDDGNLIQSNALVSTTNGAVYNISLNLGLTGTSGLKVNFYKGTTLYRSFDASTNVMSFSFIVKLDQGETIAVKIQNTGSFGINLMYAYFSGYRVH